MPQHSDGGCRGDRFADLIFLDEIHRTYDHPLRARLVNTLSEIICRITGADSVALVRSGSSSEAEPATPRGPSSRRREFGRTRRGSACALRRPSLCCLRTLAPPRFSLGFGQLPPRLSTCSTNSHGLPRHPTTVRTVILATYCSHLRLLAFPG